MIVLICILLILIIILLTIILGYKREMKSISKQIKSNLDEYINVKTASMDKDLEELVCKINILFDEKQKVIAEKGKKEEELRASISNMSHDLRTPLTSIIGYLQIVRSESVLKEEKDQYMEIIEKRTQVLQNLISSFYDLSRIEESQYKFNFKSLKIDNILCENIALFYNEFMSKEIEPTIEIDSNVKEIISDEAAISRIFSNLINNMIKYGENYIRISLKQEKDCIITEFTNKTTNLTDENVENLFIRFYTVDKSRNDRNTGLGLYITKVLVEKLGNTIEAKLIDNNLRIIIKWHL